MKKLLLTLIVSFAFCGSIFAQYESHWPGFYYPLYADQTPFVAAIELDGEIVTADNHPDNWDALEIAFFVDDVYRGTNNYLYNGYVVDYGDPFPIIDGVPVYFDNANEVVTVRMFDHVNQIEYNECTVTYLGEPYTILTGGDNIQGWFDPENPIILHFTTPITEPEEYTWNQPEGEWTGPDAGGDVIIPDNSIVTIPDGVVAIADSITLGEGSSIVIEEGGQLYHNYNVEVTMSFDVNGYNPSAKDSDNAGYRLIASPVYTNTRTRSLPINGTRLNVGEFDLYRFDQSTSLAEWVNYKADGYVYDDDAPINFDELILSEGYLYANEENSPIIFSGQTLPTNNTETRTLAYTAERMFSGWNLVGNPFTCNANVDKPYYKLTTDGSAIAEAQLNNVDLVPLQGIFVNAEAENESCTFTAVPVGGSGTGGMSGGIEEKSIPNIKMNVTHNNGTIDVAYMRFDGGQGLAKFQLNANSSKLYMPENGKDYAIVSSGDQGMQPVNFVAEYNGTYTINFTTEAVSFNYLHLIDNMTGADVDLLANPSYTFNAKTTDYASRFKLVFATGNNSNDDNFAFMSNGNLVINNEGKATVQVIDVTGRILSSESINGSASINIDAAAGVYMIRLINGNDVKVQKMVVR